MQKETPSLLKPYSSVEHITETESSPAGTLPQTAVAGVHLPTGIFLIFFPHY